MPRGTFKDLEGTFVIKRVPRGYLAVPMGIFENR